MGPRPDSSRIRHLSLDTLLKMTPSDKITQDMKTLGFSAYECKAYLALLEDFPVNGYALS